MISSAFRASLVWSWRLLIFVVVFFNARLYWPSPLASHDDTLPPSLVAQLDANRAAIDGGCPANMQQLFPEGYYFSYVFHGLAWVELAIRDETYSQKAISESLQCLSQLESAEGRRPFPSDLPPDHGMFYSAWKCSLRSGVVLLQDGNDPQQLENLRDECDAISDAIQASPTPFLASYRGSAWPCDTIPGIHALVVYDRITKEDRYTEFVKSWLQDARLRTDPETGLLPHTASLPDGRNVGVARATSQVIMLRYLPDIDPAFAKDQYQRFRDRYQSSFFGAPCVLEYPSGITGRGDVDSGVLIFGRSITGTVVTMAIAQVYGDRDVAHAIAQCGETIGLPWTSGGKKQYVGGIMPIGNIIVAYSHVARPWFAGSDHHPDTRWKLSSMWRWQIHAMSMLVFLPIITRRIIRRKKDQAAVDAETS